MKTWLTGWLLLFLAINNIFSPLRLGAHTYYIAAGEGSDSNTGRSRFSPWQTIDKINHINFQQGDILLFKRGDVFPGEIKLRQSGLHLNSYGQGDLPVISGAVPCSNWHIWQNNIWRAPFARPVKNLFFGEKQLLKARTPNQGWHIIQEDGGSTSLITDKINPAQDYYKHGRIVMRTTDWNYDYANITASGNNKIYFDSKVSHPFYTKKGQGFYIDGLLTLLDQPQEWCWHDGYVYLMLNPDQDPNLLPLKAVIYDFGIREQSLKPLNKITVKNICFKQQGQDGIYVPGRLNKAISITNCNFISQWRNGIYVKGDRHIISHNYFKGCNGSGISANDLKHCRITYNTFRDIGMVPGYGKSGQDGNVGIVVNQFGLPQGGRTTNIISYNDLARIGYCGISFRGAHFCISKNKITAYGMRASDGGGIYCWNNQQDITKKNIIRKNFISLGKRYLPGTTATVSQNFGIYIDNKVHHCVVEKNIIVSNSGSGIVLNSQSHHITVRENISIANKSQLTIAAWRSRKDNRCSVFSNTVYKNFLVSTVEGQPCIAFKHDAPEIKD
ncbi:MAG TPA: right-handed parallel beta-helix repeat-containing protein, partial [Spirochaetota bacterium]|nr:right-handed parallel beta-helix repeat-containing protein [Spirochaetota bacterium]